MISPTRKSAPVGKLAPGLVGVVHRAVHAVAEAELPGQPEGQRPDGRAGSRWPQRLDHRAVVVGREPALDLGLEAESAAEVGLLHAVNVHWSLEVLDPCRTPDRGPHSRKQRASPPGLENCRQDGFAGCQPPTVPVPRTGQTRHPCWTAPGSRFRCRPETPAPRFVPATAPQSQRRAEATRPWAGLPRGTFPPPTLVQGRARVRRRYPPEPYGSPETGEARTTRRWRLRTASPDPFRSSSTPDAVHWTSRLAGPWQASNTDHRASEQIRTMVIRKSAVGACSVVWCGNEEGRSCRRLSGGLCPFTPAIAVKPVRLEATPQGGAADAQ